MMFLLALLRLARRLRGAHAAARTALTPSVAPEPPTEAAPPPQRRHGPTRPQSQAEKCGQCSEPLTDNSPTLDFCSDACGGTYARGLSSPIPYSSPIPFRPIRPSEAHVDPPWLAAITAWERAKAARLVAERKSPGSEKAA